MRIWKDYTIEDPIIVIEKVIKPETINSYWRKPRPDVVHDFTGFTTEPTKEIMKEMWIWRGWRRGEVQGFKIGILEKFRSW